MDKFFNNLFAWVRGEERKVRKFIENFGKKSVLIIQALKVLVNSRTVKDLAANTSKKWDDEALAIVRYALDLLFPGVTIPEGANTADVIAAHIKNIRAASPEMRAALYFKLASILVRYFAEKDSESLTATQADTIAQLSYKAVKDGLKV